MIAKTCNIARVKDLLDIMLIKTKETCAHYLGNKSLDKKTFNMYTKAKVSIAQILKQLVSFSYRALEELGENSKVLQ